MKLVMFQKTGDPRLGFLMNDQVIDLNLACEAMLQRSGDPRARLKASLMLPPETIQFLEGGDESNKCAHEAVEWVKSQQPESLKARGIDVVQSLDGVRLWPRYSSLQKLSVLPITTEIFYRNSGWNLTRNPGCLQNLPMQ